MSHLHWQGAVDTQGILLVLTVLSSIRMMCTNCRIPDYHMPQHAEIWRCLAVKKGGVRVDNATSYGFHGHVPRCGTRVVKVEFTQPAPEYTESIMHVLGVFLVSAK